MRIFPTRDTDEVYAQLTVELQDGSTETYQAHDEYKNVMSAVHELGRQYPGSIVKMTLHGHDTPHAVYAA